MGGGTPLKDPLLRDPHWERIPSPKDPQWETPPQTPKSRGPPIRRCSSNSTSDNTLRGGRRETPPTNHETGTPHREIQREGTPLRDPYWERELPLKDPYWEGEPP